MAVSDCYTFDSEDYCEVCLPVGENDRGVSVDLGGRDSPANCCRCHRPLRYFLTDEGRTFVLEALAEAIEYEVFLDTEVCEEEGYYKGGPTWGPLVDWAVDIENSSPLEGLEAAVLDAFLTLSGEAQHRFERRERSTTRTVTYLLTGVGVDGEPRTHEVVEVSPLTDYRAWLLGRRVATTFCWKEVTGIQEFVTAVSIIHPVMELVMSNKTTGFRNRG